MHTQSISIPKYLYLSFCTLFHTRGTNLENRKWWRAAKAAASTPKNHSFTSWRLLWIVCFHNRCESFSRELKSSLYFNFWVVEICINVLFQILWKSRCYILVTFPSYLKKLRSILRTWLEKLNCGFFHSFHSWKNTTKQLFQSKFQCRK